MARTDGTYRPGVSIHEAAVMMGVSPSTVRRWVASGKLRSQRFDRPQGEVVRVFVGAEQMQVPPVEREQVPHVQIPADAPPLTTVQVSTEDQAAAIASLIQVTVREAITPLVAANERQGERIAVLERENGRLSAELERAASAVVALSDELKAAATAPESPQEGPTSSIAAETAADTRSSPYALWERWLLVVIVVLVVVVGWLWLR